MEKKKTKLTISGSSKKPIRNFQGSKNLGKKTVIIEKNYSKSPKKGNFDRSPQFKQPQPVFKRGVSSKTIPPKTGQALSDFERRKLAEQRATKRLKGDIENREKKTKTSSKKREVKLTVSRALSDEIETRERSLASVKGQDKKS